MRHLDRVVWLAAVLLGCGGSSSETPPPLEPDPARLRGTAAEQPEAVPGAPVPSQPPGAAPTPVPVPSAIPALPVRRGPVTSTWGTSPPPPPELAPEPE